LRQGEFRANDGEIDVSFLSGLGQGLKVSGADIDVLGNQASAGVSGSYIYLLDPGALPELPYESVLPGSTSNDQHLQCLVPLIRLPESIMRL
jgi:hypothetical protein